MERGIISGSKEILKSKGISSTETDLDYSTMEDISQDGIDDEEKCGGTEEMANGMASLGITEFSRPTTTTATTNERGENLDELPPDKTRRGTRRKATKYEQTLNLIPTTITKMTKKRGKETMRSQKQKDN